MRFIVQDKGKSTPSSLFHSFGYIHDLFSSIPDIINDQDLPPSQEAISRKLHKNRPIQLVLFIFIEIYGSDQNLLDTQPFGHSRPWNNPPSGNDNDDIKAVELQARDYPTD